MSPQTAKLRRASSRRARRKSLWQQALLMLALAALWVFLWDTVSVFSVLSGLVLAFALTRVFYLPPVELSGRFDPRYALVFVGWFLYRVVVASFQVAWSAVRPHGVGAGSVIEVELHTRSDLLITLISQVNGLIPGSVVLEVDRARSNVYIHVLDAAEDREIDAARQEMATIEYLLIRAMGSPHDIAILNEYRRGKGLPPVLERKDAAARARAAGAGGRNTSAGNPSDSTPATTDQDTASAPEERRP